MPSFDPNQLPELGSQFLPNQTPVDQQRKKLMVSLLKGGIGPLNYQLNGRGLQAQGNFQNVMANGLLKFNGDNSLSVSTPVLGGNLTAKTNSQNGNRNYFLGFERKF